MKQGSPVQFVAGFFQTIAPYTQRIGRKTERCGTLGVPNAAPVHLLHMHAPERAKRNRTAVRAHAVAIAPRPLGPVRLPVLRLPSRHFPAQFLQIFRAFARILRALQMARPHHQRCCREVAAVAIVLRVQRFDTMPRHARTSTGCRLAQERRSHRWSSVQRKNPKWSENKISERRAGFGCLRTPD